MGNDRDIGLVLSGGGVNGTLLELGFLRRLRESPLWERVAVVFGTSAGALAGTMAALDRLDDFERFMLDLRPEDAFRPNRLWRLPLLGTHDYTLPATIAERVGPLLELAEGLAASPIELVVCATDVTDASGVEHGVDFELVYSSRTTPPAELAEAIVASAAVSALVLPVRVGDRIATDGAWTRNFPLALAYRRPEVASIVAFRYLPRYGPGGTAGLVRLRQRLVRFGRVPPVRALIAELDEALERERRGEPPHAVDMIRRLLQIAVLRNTELEERLADEKDTSIHELGRLSRELEALLARHVRGPRRRERAREELRELFAAAEFPFAHDRSVPRLTVRATVGEVSLEPGFRRPQEWTDEAKLALIRRGWELTDRELAARAVELRLAG